MKIIVSFVFVAVIIFQFQSLTAKHLYSDEIPITTESEMALKYFKEGQDALDLGKFLEARALFKKAVTEDPNFAYALLGIANAAASFDEFKKFTNKAAEKAENVSEGERLLIEINQTYLEDANEKRVQIANTLVEKYPNSVRAHLALASVLSNRNEHDNARKVIGKAIDVNPELVVSYLTMGNSYLFNDPKDFEKAESYMLKATELRPDEANTFIGLGDVHRAAKDLKKSREAYTKATEVDPQNAIAVLKKGHINSFLDNFDEARADYDAALKMAKEGQKASYANYRAFTYLHEGKPEIAVQELQRIVDEIPKMDMPDDQRDGTSIFTLTNQAHITLRNNMFTKARACLDKRSEHVRNVASLIGTPQIKATQEANIALWEGLLSAYEGDFEKAEAMAKKNKELLVSSDDPQKMQPYHNLHGMISLKKGDYAAAAKHFEQADLNDIYVKFHLAEALRGMGDSKSAALYREVADYNFNSVEFAMIRKEALKRSAMAVN